MTKILVTGINGFVGHHVAAELHKRDVMIIGVGNQKEPQEDLLGIVGEYISCDLTNAHEVSRIDLGEVDAIINLAGFAKVGESRGRGELYNRVNVGVHATLYQECLNQGVSPRVIAVSTGAVYDSEQTMPITESSALVPDERTNEYVISKKLTEEAVLGFNDKGLHCIIVRPFNHTGPGQLPGFLLPDLYEQVQQSIATGEPMKVGNLQTKRDFTDVRDVARAYVELATCSEASLRHDVYNICSGKSTQGQEILDILARACGANELKAETDSARLRSNDVMDIYGSYERLAQDTGWQPEISVSQMVEDFVASKI